jgi:diacylglycerol O-acyltransferase
LLEWARLRPDDGYLIGVALRLEGPKPTPGRIAALVTARLPHLPALTEHLDGPAGEERWRTVEDFDARRHIQVLHTPGDLGHCAEVMINQPLWDDRPRWSLSHLETGRGGEFVLVYRAHHAAQDGAAVAHTLKLLLDARAPALPQNACVTAGPTLYTRAPACTGSRLLATAVVPLDALRAVVQASGASLNDVYLAALAGALRAWMPPSERHNPVPVRVPFTVRRRHERQDRGNRYGFQRVLLPVDEPRPDRRLAAVFEQTGSWPRDRVRRLLDRMPDEMLRQHIAASLTPDDALASVTLLGVPTPLAFDGSPVTAGVALPPLASGHLFSCVLFAYGTRATVSFTARAHHQHVRDLPRLWEQELSTLATASPLTPPPRRA